jgi:hypothetical protein
MGQGLNTFPAKAPPWRHRTLGSPLSLRYLSMSEALPFQALAHSLHLPCTANSQWPLSVKFRAPAQLGELVSCTPPLTLLPRPAATLVAQHSFLISQRHRPVPEAGHKFFSWSSVTGSGQEEKAVITVCPIHLALQRDFEWVLAMLGRAQSPGGDRSVDSVRTEGETLSSRQNVKVSLLLQGIFLEEAGLIWDLRHGWDRQGKENETKLSTQLENRERLLPET